MSASRVWKAIWAASSREITLASTRPEGLMPAFTASAATLMAQSVPT